jgi:hypothetical protein
MLLSTAVLVFFYPLGDRMPTSIARTEEEIRAIYAEIDA